MPNFCGSRPCVEAEALQQRLGEVAARAFGEQRVFRAQLHAAGEAVLVLAVLADAHVAGGDAGHRAVVIVQHLGGGKARIDFDAQRFRLGGEPAADIAEGDDVVAVIVHQRRHHEIRQTQRARGDKPIEAVVGDLGLDRRVLAAPVRHAAGRGRWDRSRRRRGCARRPRSPFRPRPRLVSGESCLSRIAAASPAGPAPTITTSNSIASRAGNSSALIGPPVGDRVPARRQASHRGPGY